MAKQVSGFTSDSKLGSTSGRRSSHTSSQFDATFIDPKFPNVLDACSGYKATDVSASGTKFTATLVLGGKPCNVFVNDIQKLSLSVKYETVYRIHCNLPTNM
ncbi:uncharacterized protein LACBIDRAFT_299755 [Laccaria bicolor S238N-H82]|uniref:Predicted protein n=1 Tax=Laccaria bicolor (strain S238N-H82 / ATCC MYA-4686) TaxID=486041 RepID=B0DFD4_LACBS|nr:uncharacterized protein LACBIDRAFT_299755 [Laccaria bicolor S238N-H82]EDR06846.1 predicted protein [Laccaria bicolor S238N-H82]|eukprot:XP_001882693.1 predicted protein [Laccaria bicolor S238N-H82]